MNVLTQCRKEVEFEKKNRFAFDMLRTEAVVASALDTRWIIMKIKQLIMCSGLGANGGTSI